jgi:hypothetical protein
VGEVASSNLVVPTIYLVFPFSNLRAHPLVDSNCEMHTASLANGPRNSEALTSQSGRGHCGPPRSRSPFERLQSSFPRIVARTSGWPIVTLWAQHSYPAAFDLPPFRRL